MPRSVPKIAFALALATLLYGCGQDTAVTVEPQQNAATSGFILPDLDGRKRRLEEWRGRVVVLNFWAPWCPPCRKEMPDLVKLQETYGPRGLTVVGLTVDTRDNAQTFVDLQDINYPILVAEAEAIDLARDYGNKVGILPYTVVLDRRGRPVYTHRGEISFDQAAQVITPLL